ncbi:hypothetical protein Pcac1_g9961 [Phytophthora cactorum]|uniref:Uncharacterized protein n=1 Tax=Phytophthora cactorum TaxID=29920 RepID=A0A329SIN6_9STRA|nr:hypothetical protein Pcac1_g9961 [Phytophthora cactorum]KAG2896455.1 hypothetical protein PC114_g15065 [Phytophthora cactorum]KAG3099504.1 hypothetical protein PC122_g3507 [Phytophthora cactorum]RAW36595.1 hypothetical protein PC110_g7142 [Phytophthora cactorum]
MNAAPASSSDMINQGEDVKESCTAEAVTTGGTTASTRLTNTSNVASVPQPIFATVAAPKVTSTSRDALIEWLKLRKEYVDAMNERCKDGKEDINAVLRSVKSSFDDDLLNTLCEATWIHAITDSYQNQVLPPVNELFAAELTMDMKNNDIQSRVTDYFLSCNSLIKKYGFASFFEGDKGAKKKCKLLLNSLPGDLKVKVKNELDYRCPEASTSVLRLLKLINQQALEQAIEDRALKRIQDTNRKLKPREQNRDFQGKKRPFSSCPTNNPGSLRRGKSRLLSTKRSNNPRKGPHRKGVSIAAGHTT